MKMRSSEKRQNRRVLILPRLLLCDTREYFLPYWQAKVETACYWYGVDTGEIQVATTLVLPQLRQTSGNYYVIAESLARLATTLGDQNLVTLAQIHTHPGNGRPQHSPYDDERAYSTRDGALSFVWPNYGETQSFGLNDVGVHERNKGGWLYLTQEQVSARICIVDSILDSRWAIDRGMHSSSSEWEYKA